MAPKHSVNLIGHGLLEGGRALVIKSMFSYNLFIYSARFLFILFILFFYSFFGSS